MNILKCKVNKCEEISKSRGFCIKHYLNAYRHEKGLHKERKKCLSINCKKNAIGFDLCYKCIDFILSKDKQYKKRTFRHLKGKNNVNWNGGVSEYKNHYIFKKNRLIVLNQFKNRCSDCNAKADQVHHKDKNKKNHSLDNLQLLCRKCHKKYHKKLFFIKGINIETIAKETGISLLLVKQFYKKKYIYWKKQDIIKKYIAEKIA